MLRITDSSHNFLFNNCSITPHFRASDTIPYFDDNLLMSDLYYIDENKSIQKISHEMPQNDFENFDLLKDLEDSNETNKSKEKFAKRDRDNNNYTNDKKHIQEIQSRVKEKIYLREI